MGKEFEDELMKVIANGGEPHVKEWTTIITDAF